MKATEIRNLSDQDLGKKLMDLKQELFNLRFQNATGQLENPNAIGAVKRDIARVKTVIRERELKERKEA
ncbi:MAG: 50S ribosomal protein L29 [Peptoniphilaceae bacterium]|nr:50S ribosomal protein L29 [Peptoniphilaceae bacterium]MCI6659956.1 50S ribosomal protein L29 [Peptoniphilaceae bacterium]MDD7434386.1 50S ribosomal protein L29 [Peptoniphilaceae bacterium]MDY3076378.1 50S ribosomal protein L29 [Peptoniphilaceae bacterium]MDY4197108.1 50S ribosomal protein L29 [Peptoniphilaceae bacterium]